LRWRIYQPEYPEWEKLYETLLTKEDHFVAQDLGSFFRVPADTHHYSGR
jgi:FlaA1/EpsC-like NDP-sugar epimerase